MGEKYKIKNEIKSINGKIPLRGGVYLPNNPYKVNKVNKRHIRKLLVEGCMVTKYQPIINHKHERIVAFEGLCRAWWKGPIPPDLLFQRAIAFGNSYEVDMNAMRCAIDMFWYRTELNADLFLNVLPITLLDARFLRDFERLLVSSGAPVRKIVLELTEMVSYDMSRLRGILQRLRNMGIRIALDDLGRGSASLSAIAHIEPEMIKIDRSLIDGISHSSENQRVVSAFIDFIGDCSTIVAEGLENWDDALAVAEMGIELSQGFVWSKAVHLSDIDCLKVAIEMKRFTLYRWEHVNGYPLSHFKVLEKSHEIDELMNNLRSANSGHLVNR